jgi:hypothetical protein
MDHGTKYVLKVSGRRKRRLRKQAAMNVWLWRRY